MATQEFSVLKQTASGHLLLESLEEEKPAFAHPRKAFLGRKHAATILETFASVKEPYYLAKPAPGVAAEGLVGEKVEVRL
jgi:hypothetical protein